MDKESVHIYLEEEGEILGYLRIFRQNSCKSTVQIGRVLTIQRGMGFGKKLLQKAVEIIEKEMKPKRIFLEAQCQARGFYEKIGFKVCTEEFMEDGIPHVGMEIFCGNHTSQSSNNWYG